MNSAVNINFFVFFSFFSPFFRKSKELEKIGIEQAKEKGQLKCFVSICFVLFLCWVIHHNLVDSIVRWWASTFWWLWHWIVWGGIGWAWCWRWWWCWWWWWCRIARASARWWWLLNTNNLVFAAAIFGLRVLFNEVLLDNWSWHLDDFLFDDNWLGSNGQCVWDGFALAWTLNDNSCWFDNNWWASVDNIALCFAIDHYWWLFIDEDFWFRCGGCGWWSWCSARWLRCCTWCCSCSTWCWSCSGWAWWCWSGTSTMAMYQTL